MTKPVIFNISAAWDDKAAVQTGHCDDISAAADAPTLEELLAKISSMALDLLPDNHPGVDPASLYLQPVARGADQRSVIRQIRQVSAQYASLLRPTRYACLAYHDEHVRNLKTRRVQVDEIWSFTYAKQKNVAKAKRQDMAYGDTWTWTAIDADNKLMISWLVGGRDDAKQLAMCNALQFWRRCRGRECKRRHACSGDPEQCFKRHWALYSQDDKVWVRAMLKASVDGLSPPEAVRAADAELSRHVALMAKHAPMAPPKLQPANPAIPDNPPAAPRVRSV